MTRGLVLTMCIVWWRQVFVGGADNDPPAALWKAGSSDTHEGVELASISKYCRVCNAASGRNDMRVLPNWIVLSHFDAHEGIRARNKFY